MAKQTVISIEMIDVKPDELVYRPLIPLLQMFWQKLLLNMFSNQVLSTKILFYIAAALTQVKKKYKGFEAPVVSKKKGPQFFFYINGQTVVIPSAFDDLSLHCRKMR